MDLDAPPDADVIEIPKHLTLLAAGDTGCFALRNLDDERELHIARCNERNQLQDVKVIVIDSGIDLSNQAPRVVWMLNDSYLLITGKDDTFSLYDSHWNKQPFPITKGWIVWRVNDELLVVGDESSGNSIIRWCRFAPDGTVTISKQHLQYRGHISGMSPDGQFFMTTYDKFPPGAVGSNWYRSRDMRKMPWNMFNNFPSMGGWLSLKEDKHDPRR